MLFRSQKERYFTFVDDYLNFVGEIPESPYRRELDVMYKRAQRALGKYSGTDDELNVKEKDFIKDRKSTIDARSKALEKEENLNLPVSKKRSKNNAKNNETLEKAAE